MQDFLIPRGKGTLEVELHRTAEMLIDIAEKDGIYFAVALLYDSNYDIDRIKKLLPILEKMKGSRKNIKKNNI